MIIVTCPFGGPDHEFEDDWIFGGADGSHPGADPRSMPTHYQYLNAELVSVFLTGSLLCDDEAFHYFTTVAKIDSTVTYITVKRPGNERYSIMHVKYVQSEDIVYDWEPGE